MSPGPKEWKRMGSKMMGAWQISGELLLKGEEGQVG